MFTEREVPEHLDSLLEETTPAPLVLDCQDDFEAMPAEWVYDLAIVTDEVAPLSYPTDWIPPNAPEALKRTTGSDPAIGLPGDGSVTWTRQTQPPIVFVKPRATGMPEGFRDFLLAEAIVQIDGGYPETPAGFFEERYGELQDITDSPEVAYRLSVALLDAWIGLQTRERFGRWRTDRPRLWEAWQDAGDRLTDRVGSIPSLVADGTLGFAEATELACSAVKHDIDLPSPYAALDVTTYRDQGAPFAIRWAEKTMDQLQDS